MKIALYQMTHWDFLPAEIANEKHANDPEFFGFEIAISDEESPVFIMVTTMALADNIAAGKTFRCSGNVYFITYQPLLITREILYEMMVIATKTLYETDQDYFHKEALRCRKIFIPPMQVVERGLNDTLMRLRYGRSASNMNN